MKTSASISWKSLKICKREKTFCLGRGTGSSHRATLQGPGDTRGEAASLPAPPAPYVLQDLDGDSVHEADGAEVQDDGVEAGLGQPQGAQGGLGGRAALRSAQLNHRHARTILSILCVLGEGRRPGLTAQGLVVSLAGQCPLLGAPCPIAQWGLARLLGCVRAQAVGVLGRGDLLTPSPTLGSFQMRRDPTLSPVTLSRAGLISWHQVSLCSRS